MKLPLLSKGLALVGGLMLCNSVASAQSDNYFSMSLDLGNAFFYGDRTDKSYPSNRPNFAILPQIGYHAGNTWTVTGQLGAGLISGKDEDAHFQTAYVEPTVYFGYNILTLFDKDTRYALELEAGAGWMSFFTEVYDNGTGEIISKIPGEGTVSQSAFGIYGAKFRMPVSRSVSINLGYANRAVVNNDWMDGLASDKGNDSFGVLSAGVTFSFNQKPKKGEKIVNKSEYESLVSEKDNLKAELEIEQNKNEAVLKEKDARIADLQSHIENLKSIQPVTSQAQATKIETTNRKNQIKTQYHIVVGSFSQVENAQNFVSETFKGEESKIKIVFSEDTKLYRVVYESTDQYQAAKEDARKLAPRIPDAWVAQF
ncbi:MAG: hypothetical protein SchgKO_11240 [Schleiferiaceae bacterium]